MVRVPLDTACAIAQVKPGTIRQWVHRGIIKRYEDGYDVQEILLWLDQRNKDHVITGMRAAHQRYQATRPD